MAEDFFFVGSVIHILLSWNNSFHSVCEAPGTELTFAAVIDKIL